MTRLQEWPQRQERPRGDVLVGLERFAERSRAHRVATDVFKDVVVEDSIMWADPNYYGGIVGQFKGSDESPQDEAQPLYVTIQDGGTGLARIDVFSDRESAMRVHSKDLRFRVEERDGRVRAKLQMVDADDLDLGSDNARVLEVAIAIRNAFQAGR